MAGTKSTIIDPFGILPKPLRWLRNKSSRYVLRLFVPISAILVLASLGEGQFGTYGDWQPLQDAKRALSIGAPPSSESFPFLRDFPTWGLAVLLVLTAVAVHHQWRLFRLAVPQLCRSGALTRRSKLKATGRQRILLRLMSKDEETWRYDEYIGWINNRISRLGARSWVLAVLSVGLAVLLTVGERSLGLFRVLAPAHSTTTQLNSFSRSAYVNWWASMNHPLGWFVYVLLFALGIYLVVVQNAIGIYAVLIVVTITAFYETGVDWFDRDGSFGWRPLGIIYRTVRWALAMDAIAFTILFVVVGFDESFWVSALFLAWLLALPLYLGAPWFAFRNVAGAAKTAALREVHQFSLKTRPPGTSQVEHASTIVPFIRDAKIRPLRLSRFGAYAFFVAIILPSLLVGLEIFAQLRFGSSHVH